MRLGDRGVDQVPWRRAIVLLLLALASIPLATLLKDSWTTGPSAEDIAEAKKIVAAGRPYELEEIKRCEADPGSYGPPNVDQAARSQRSACEEMLTTHYEDLLEAPTLDLDAARGDLTPAAIISLVGLMMLIGATFVGPAWSMGFWGTQLVLETRRLRTWLAKALAVTAASTVAGIVVLTLAYRAPCSETTPANSPATDCRRDISTWDGGVHLLVLVLVAFALSRWSMRRRDVP